MPEEVGTEATRSDAPSADESLFGDAPDAKGGTAQEPEGSDEDAGKAAEDPKGSGDAEGDAAPEALKVVVSIKGGRATIGVQQPSSDPHIESFDGLDESGLAQEVSAVIDRARAGWEDAPKHPAYERPAPPARRRNRRGQGSGQDANAEAETEQAQQQTLRLF